MKAAEDATETAAEELSPAAAVTTSTAEADEGRYWYGSRGITEKWVGVLFGEDVASNGAADGVGDTSAAGAQAAAASM